MSFRQTARYYLKGDGHRLLCLMGPRDVGVLLLLSCYYRGMLATDFTFYCYSYSYTQVTV